MFKKLAVIVSALVLTLSLAVAPVLATEETPQLYETTSTNDDSSYDYNYSFDTDNLSDEQAAAAAATIAGFSVMMLIVSVIVMIPVYIYMAWALMTIAKKLNVENAWMAWVPVLNIYVMVKCAGQSGFTMLLFFVPLVNFFFSIYVYMKIAERRGFDQLLGLLVLVPVANIVLPGYLAWAEPKKKEEVAVETK